MFDSWSVPREPVPPADPWHEPGFDWAAATVAMWADLGVPEAVSATRATAAAASAPRSAAGWLDRVATVTEHINRLEAERLTALAGLSAAAMTERSAAEQESRPDGWVRLSDAVSPDRPATPLPIEVVIASHVAEELVARLHWTTRWAEQALVEADALTTRLTGTLGELAAGRIDHRRAQTVVTALADLDDDDAQRCDTALVPVMAGLTPPELRAAATREAEAVDPTAATRRHHRRARGRHVSHRPDTDGMSVLTAVGPSTDVLARIEHLRRTARTLRARPGEDRTLGAIQFDLLTGITCTEGHAQGDDGHHLTGDAPHRRRVPARIQVTVSAATLAGLDDDPADLAGHGPIPATLARTLAAHPDSTIRRLVTDPVTGVLLGVDGHTLPPLTPPTDATPPRPPPSGPSAPDSDTGPGGEATENSDTTDPHTTTSAAAQAAAMLDAVDGGTAETLRAVDPDATEHSDVGAPRPGAAADSDSGRRSVDESRTEEIARRVDRSAVLSSLADSAAETSADTTADTSPTTSAETLVAARTEVPASTDPHRNPDGAPDAGPYRPPVPMQRYVRARDRFCTAPGCRRPAATCDLDHVVAHPTGPTCPCNLHPLCRRHHRMKQAPGWSVSRDPDGTTRWVTPIGQHVAVEARSVLPRPRVVPTSPDPDPDPDPSVRGPYDTPTDIQDEDPPSTRQPDDEPDPPDLESSGALARRPRVRARRVCWAGDPDLGDPPF